ncbi:phosphoribosylformylglycinamidine synthase subunit PurS [Adhaeribacter radiodurans]|uniref:Phosphoribosylformylglycinamidine synthase subunit PurS n=1 Tax=Adhaeribacter radiodurans TaxID=2745197 RepID=A0A7L7LBH9_9BACT|nr:phosphoribosylformylglycinamidine synthase subunit PurS [Adhaeribacter radiodurans]QMU30192.1 phosphoribosylformylglycinamidine synthase subunit PurS [Adhaeribacter radiodurans]
MKFTAEIDIMPHAELLDPQGKAVMLGLEHLGLEQVADVRIGKHITLALEAENETAAQEKVETACKKLLANLIMESYSYQLIAN